LSHPLQHSPCPYLTFPVVFFHCCAHHRPLHSFPTRRSSVLYPGNARRQLLRRRAGGACLERPADLPGDRRADRPRGALAGRSARDRKSTRLNSSHVAISYAVFCLKKKNEVREICATGNAECM